MFAFLARATFRSRWLFLAAGVAVLIVGATYGIHVFQALKSGGLDDPRSASAREAQRAARDFPNASISLIVLLRSARLTLDQPPYQDALGRTAAAVRRDPSVLSVTSYADTRDAHFVSQDRHETYAVVSLGGEEDAQTAAYLRLRRELPTTALKATFGGPVVADYEVNQQVQRDIPRAEVVSAPILLLLLVLIFRSVIAAALPLVIGALSVLGAFALTHALATVIPISVFAANIISLLGLGLAIDYSLLFVSRFRDEMAAGKSVAGGIDRTVRTAGVSIFFSGATVALSLLGLLAFPENFLRSMGLGGALAVVMAVAASLTVLPAALAVLGPWVNRGAIPLPRRPAGPDMTEAGSWFRFSHWVMRRAVPVIVVTLGGLLALGVPFLHARLANPGLESLPASFGTRSTGLAMRRDFADAPSAPIQILVDTPDSPVAPAQLAALSGYAARLGRLPGVRSVDSLVTLDARLPSYSYAAFYALPFNTAATDAEAHLLSGHATLVTVSYGGDSQGVAAQRLVAAVRATPPPARSHVLVGGETAELVDHLASLRRHLPAAGTAIVVATFFLLFFLLRSLLVPAKAVLLNILSLSASFGLMTWIFQDGHLETLLGFRSSGSLDATIPILIFALAFGLSTDYEVFLVSRIREEYDRTGENTEAIAVGIAKTGRIITAAALLLIVVVAAFGASRILAMKEIGVGLAVAVAIDAFIVRTLLVPATMRVLGRLNWWLPGFLRHWRTPA